MLLSSPKKKIMSAYDSHKSSACTETVADFCRAEGVNTWDSVSHVPGIGEAFKEVLERNCIFTIAQLLGIFLMEIDGEKTTQEVCQTFYDNMKEIVNGTNAKSANMHVVTFSIANYAAERALFEYNIDE